LLTRQIAFLVVSLVQSIVILTLVAIIYARFISFKTTNTTKFFGVESCASAMHSAVLTRSRRGRVRALPVRESPWLCADR